MSMTWHKRYHLDALEGMRCLTLEQRGAYTTILDLIYLRGGSLPDDQMFISGWLGVFPKTWNRIRRALIEAGKLLVEGDQLTNPRATKEVSLSKARSVENKTNGRFGGLASRKNKDIAEAHAIQTKTKTSPSEKEKKEREERESFPVEGREQKVVFLGSADAEVPPSAGRKVQTEFDLVCSDGTIIFHDEFEALNEEFGITNARNIASAWKRTFLKDVSGAQFISRMRTKMAANKNRKTRVARQTGDELLKMKASIQADLARREADYKRAAEVRARYAAR